ncbi:MAG TPA: DNA primase catalytic subunit PriS [Thermofilum sp.]|nr:DNA primase catalytic subunit PriS [Thermofilum sp.]
MSQKLAETLTHVKRLFKNYYNSTYVSAPRSPEKREYGFSLFDSQGMIRHLSFSSSKALNEFLRKRVPKHAYYSSAYYGFPDAPVMSEKKWLGADLVFDIDVDHIPTPCKILHDVWSCMACGRSGMGFYEKCPYCGSERIEKETWVCTICINVAKDEVLKLADILLSDFGVSENEMTVVFSGHRGFHLHVNNEVFKDLTQDARREIADYVRGLGLNIDILLEKVKKSTYKFKYDITSSGWRGRLARALISIILDIGDVKQLENLGFSKRRAKKVLESINESKDEPLNIPLTRKEWERLIEKALASESCVIDERVTIDTRRLIRLPGTLHGKTGLKVTKFSVGDLENKDILKESIVFNSGYVKLRVKKFPKNVLDWKFEAVGSSVIEIPTYLGVYLVLNSSEVEVLRWI